MTDNKWVDPKPRKILDDLQVLRAEIAASVGGDPGNLGQRLAAMIEQKLSALNIEDISTHPLVPYARYITNALISMGIEAEYGPEASGWRQGQLCCLVSPIQVILTYDEGEPFFTVTVNYDYSVAVLGMVCHSIDELRARLPEAIQRRRDYHAHLRASYALSEYCKGCWYSDEDGNYCGMGRVMEVGCTHKLDNQQP